MKHNKKKKSNAKIINVIFRDDERDLLKYIDELAMEEKRSRNSMIIKILENAIYE